MSVGQCIRGLEESGETLRPPPISAAADGILDLLFDAKKGRFGCGVSACCILIEVFFLCGGKSMFL